MECASSNFLFPRPSILAHASRSNNSCDGPGMVVTSESVLLDQHPHGGFLPLPSISATGLISMRTVTSTQPVRNPNMSPNNSSDCNLSEITTSLPPTWISTPPTPPPGMVRRSFTLSTRTSSEISPSASFPALSLPPLPHGVSLKRHVSLPSFSLSLSTVPESSAVPMRLVCHDKRSLDVTCLSSIVLDNNTSRGEVAIMRRTKPIFHIPRESSPDSDNSSPRMTPNLDPLHEDTGSERLNKDFSEAWRSEKAKDDLRKYHALMELLTTEVGYLLDLRALVTVYLHILPTISRPPATFGRASSFTAGPWSHPYGLANTASTVPSNSLSSPSAISNGTKSGSRYLFTDQEVASLARNAESILHLHEHFVRELHAEMTTLGISIETDEQPAQQEIRNIDSAIRTVSAKFATEASRFATYETFCIGHPEALDLVRKAQRQHPTEWEAYEQRCSSLVRELELTSTRDADSLEYAGSSEESEVAFSKKRNRTTSLSSIDGSSCTRRSSSSANGFPFPSADGFCKGRVARLMFDDYLIKPVQRICKYPLILDQLKTGKSPHLTVSDVDVVVESASHAMRHVARAIDDARHKQDVATRSSLIQSRISVVHAFASQGSQISTPQSLTPGFLASLGSCLFAGSLDVIHHHAVKPASGNIHVKYLGAFLYLGGYVILVKVLKGKLYEPKHWFPLADFDVADLDEDEAILPCSIRLTSKGHRFELAAACQREKDAWLNAIQQSRTQQPLWDNEPISSLRFDGKGDLVSSSLGDGPFEIMNALPTIQSIPELLNSPTCQPAFNVHDPEVKQRKSPKLDLSCWRQEPQPPSRRSSTTSVKSIFSPAASDSETFLVRRSSPSARTQVDLGLQDVISQLCLTVRSCASSRDQELFQAPRSTRSAFVQLQSGMAGMAKNRLTRHESVRVTRRKSFLEVSEKSAPRKSSSTGTCILSGKQPANSFFSPLSLADCRSSRSPASLQRSPRSSTMLTSQKRSPTLLEVPVLNTPSPNDIKPRLKASRSLVNNVKDFFTCRSSSSGSLSQSAKARVSEHQTKSSIHRRTRSVPDVDGTSFNLPDLENLPALDLGPPISSPNKDAHDAHFQVFPYLSANRPPLGKSHLSSSMLHIPFEIDPGLGNTRNLLQPLKV